MSAGRHPKRASISFEDFRDWLEAMGLVFRARERLSRETPFAELIPLDELARRFEREHLLDA